MEFNPLPHLLYTGFTIIEIGLFYGGEHMEAKMCSKEPRRRVITLQILVEFF